MRSTAISLTLCVGLLVLGAASVNAAPPSPALRCLTAKLMATGAEAKARLRCEQIGLASGAAASCIASATTRRDTAYVRADGKGGCAITGDAAVLGDSVAAMVAATLESLRPGGPQASRCTALQLAGASRTILRLVQAHVRDVHRPDPARLAAAVGAAQLQLASTFVRAAQKGDCLSTTDAADVGASLAQAVLGFQELLWQSTPPEPCPCWTTASLDTDLPPSFFTEAGRGGLVCEGPGALAAIRSADSCTIVAGPITYTYPRGAAAIFDNGTCAVFDDVDPSDTGSCNGGPRIFEGGLTQAETDDCIATLQASQSYQSCP